MQHAAAAHLNLRGHLIASFKKKIKSRPLRAGRRTWLTMLT
jgi:hypothetical protein